MAKINGGILGGVSGRVGNVVGGSWKGVKYLRSYAIPGYSRTDAQGDQRDNMRYLVAMAKAYVFTVLNPYCDKFISRLSGFNWMIRENMPAKKLAATVETIKVSAGPLHPGSILTAVGTDGNVTITWSTETGIDGSAGDVVVAWLRNPTTNEVTVDTTAVRSTGTVTFARPGKAGGETIYAGLFFARMNVAGTVVERISTNLNLEMTGT
jgi:hypothetical protein